MKYSLKKGSKYRVINGGNSIVEITSDIDTDNKEHLVPCRYLTGNSRNVFYAFRFIDINFCIEHGEKYLIPYDDEEML
ncbi:MAG: hypothetical protein WCT16_05100 [Candidatus Buchananbacteria bacterium]